MRSAGCDSPTDRQESLQPPPHSRQQCHSLQIWPEWKHRVFIHVNAHFKKHGKKVVEAMRRAEQQWRQIWEENLYSDERVLSWSSVFSDRVHSPTYFIQDARELFSALYTVLTSFTKDQAHKLARHAGDSEGLEEWLTEETLPRTLEAVALLETSHQPSQGRTCPHEVTKCMPPDESM